MKEASNYPHHYDVTVGDDSNYSFITDGGIKYIAYFISCESYSPELNNTYMFNFEHERDRGAADDRIRKTIIFILDEFFENNQNSAIYICDSLDGRELCRKRLFDKWFEEFIQTRGEIEREEINETGEHYTLCGALFIHKMNPNKKNVIKSFKELKDMLIV